MNEKLNLEKLGNIAQIASVNEFLNTDGTAFGLKELTCKNGRLRMNILTGRAFDIGELSYGGVNISYIGKNGFVSPAFAYSEAFPYPRSFSGGFLMTCGLDNIGSPSSVSPQHGRLTATPARLIRKETVIRDGNPVILLSAEVTQASLFGENLVLTREYEIRGDGFTLTDSVTNRGFIPAQVIFMYHFNLGYPMLDENAVIEVGSRGGESFTVNSGENGFADKTGVSENAAAVRERNEIKGAAFEIHGHDEKAEKNKFLAGKFAPPEKDIAEECFYYSVPGPVTYASVFNPSLGMRVSFDYGNANLPYLIEWKNPLSGEYVLGIEPASSKLNDKRFISVQPSQSIRNSIAVSFSD
jgi:hypothetical protein